MLINEKLLGKTLITGDLNTLDTRFGKNHKDKHPYLDEVLAPAGPLRIISDRNSYTRENHTLDITLGTQAAKKDLEQWKVLHRLDSDHYPTLIKIRSNSTNNTAEENPKDPKQNTYLVLDCKETEKTLLKNLEALEENEIRMDQLSTTLNDAITKKTIKYKPISFWNSTLNKAKNQRNRARRAIITARNQGRNTQRRVIKYKRKKQEFAKAFRKAKLKSIRDQLVDACKDSTGAAIYKLIKKVEPTLNKKRSTATVSDKSPEQEAEEIADKFEKIFDQEDTTPSTAEDQELAETL